MKPKRRNVNTTTNLLGKVASAVRRVQDLIVEDGKVQSQSKADGMSRGHLDLADVKCLLEILLLIERVEIKIPDTQLVSP
jgi:hypothetical protein